MAKKRGARVAPPPRDGEWALFFHDAEAAARPIRPLRPSFASLLLGLETRGEVVSTVTGFVVRRGDRAYLVSNGHVFSGRDPISKTSTHCPDTVRFKYWRVGAAPSLEEHSEPLQRDAQPRWLEHPSLGARADVAALPLAADAVPYLRFGRTLRFSLTLLAPARRWG